MLKKPKFVIRRAAKSTAEEIKPLPEPPTMEGDEAAPSETLTPAGNQVSDAIPADEGDHPTQGDPSIDAGPHPPAPPPVPGFTLEGASTGHQYAIRSLVTLCDCCVQKSPDGIFDVLGRNFVDTGGLMWWLRKVGKPHVAE